MDVEGDGDVLLGILLGDVERSVESARDCEIGAAVVELDDTVVVLLPAHIAVLTLHEELVLDVSARGHLHGALPDVALGPLEIDAVLPVPSTELIGVAHDAHLLAVGGAGELDGEVEFDLVLGDFLVVVSRADDDGAAGGAAERRRGLSRELASREF